MLMLAILLISILPKFSKGQVIWTPENVNTLQNGLISKQPVLQQIAWNVISHSVPPNLDIDNVEYWDKIPYSVLQTFKDDEVKLSFYVSQLLDVENVNDVLYYRYARRLTELGSISYTKWIVFKVAKQIISPAEHLALWKLGPELFAKELFVRTENSTISTTNKWCLYEICNALFKYYFQITPKDKQVDLDTHWIYAKTLVKLNILHQAIAEYVNITHYNNFINNDDIYWKSCIEFGNLLVKVHGWSSLKKMFGNPYNWAVNRIVYHKPAANKLEYYQQRFEWIKDNVDQKTFRILLDMLLERCPQDIDVIEKISNSYVQMRFHVTSN